MEYTITLADNRKLTDLSKNGNNFVSKEKIDETIFENNLSTMTVSDGEITEMYNDMIFVQQMEWADGTYYLAFREKTAQEKILEKISKNNDSVTDLRMALAEVYKMILTGGASLSLKTIEDVPERIREQVRKLIEK